MSPGDPSIIDARFLDSQRAWSQGAFGPGRRTKGVLDHIRKEIEEVEEEPLSLEWVDIVILALDGAHRAGWSSQEIIDAIHAKLVKNQARTWPDWRTMTEDQAIEHDRTHDAPKKCWECLGDGRIASGDEGGPWSAWENLPPGSDLAVRMGIVRPITCPKCNGTGEGR